MTHFEQTVRPLVNELLNNSRLLFEQLKIDQRYFEKNDISSIEASNVKKNATNNKLLAAVNALMNDSRISSYDGGLIERIQQYAQSLPPNDKKWFLRQLVILKEEIPVYNQTLHVNRTILHTNLVRTKELFCALFNSKNTNEPSIYKPSGIPGAVTISLE